MIILINFESRWVQAHRQFGGRMQTLGQILKECLDRMDETLTNERKTDQELINDVKFWSNIKQYCTFNTSKGMKTAEIIKINELSVIAKPITFGKRSMISKITQIIQIDAAKKFKKKRVTIYNKGTMPIN